MATTVKVKKDIYQDVTNTIIDMMEKGIADPNKFKQPWKAIGIGHRSALGRSYRGMNTLLLACAANEKGYDVPVWGTFKQWKTLGCSVKKGEKATMVVLWKSFQSKKKDADGNDKVERGMWATAFNVFNVAQVKGDLSKVPGLKSLEERQRHTDERDAIAEDWIASTGASISYGGDMAYYTPGADRVSIPLFESFDSSVTYYATIGHELTHWSGNDKRMARDLTGRFGTQSYAAEELVAELGSAFLMARLGLESEPREDHAHYLASWVQMLKDDKRAIFTASSKAQAAADYLLPEKEMEEIEIEEGIAINAMDDFMGITPTYG